MTAGSRAFVLSLALPWGLAQCSSSPAPDQGSPPDGSQGAVDANGGGGDASTPGEGGSGAGDASGAGDGGTQSSDARSPTTDAGSPGADGSSPGADGSLPGADGSSPGADAGSPSGDAGTGWDAVPGILSRIVAPTFPNLDCDVTNYGGVGDGVTDNTTAFAMAIADCSSRGGGRVVAPAGTFFTGPIELLSNVNLYVPAGVTIKFSTDPTKYLPVVKVSWEGNLAQNYRPLISAHDATNIAITGGGTIDGNATMNDWYAWIAQQGPDQLAIRTQNATGVPPDQRIYGMGHFLRPSLIEFMNCTNILLDGFTAQNSPFWTIHPVMSKNITARGLHSLGSQPNTDGFDPESCVDVLLDNLTIQVGDDPIAIKAGRDVDGRTYYSTTENVVIQNCTFLAKNAGVAVGSEMSAGVRNVYVQDSTFSAAGGGLGQALYMKASVYRGGFIENVYARRLTVGQVGIFFFLNGQYSSAAVPTASVIAFTTFNNFNVDTATVASSTAEPFRITGADATKVATGMHFSNITVTTTPGAALRAGAAHYADLTTSNVTVNGAAFTPPASAP